MYLPFGMFWESVLLLDMILAKSFDGNGHDECEQKVKNPPMQGHIL